MNSGKVTGELQKEFSDLFPYLKIEFYDAGNHQPLPVDQPVALYKRVGDLSKLIKDDIQITFSDTTSVKDLEKEILKEAGVQVRIFRKFGPAWLPIVLTQEWTLKYQNEQGKEISTIN